MNLLELTSVDGSKYAINPINISYVHPGLVFSTKDGKSVECTVIVVNHNVISVIENYDTVLSKIRDWKEW